MRIGIFGTGGIGGFFGARLAAAGEDVVFIARGGNLAALQKGGLHLASPLGDLHISPVRASGNPAEAGVVDAVIVGVKAWQVAGAAEAMRPMVGPQTIVLPMQNGVEAAGQLAAVLGSEHVLGGTVRIITRLAAAGRVEHIGFTPRLALGELDGTRTARVERLAAALERTGTEVTLSGDISLEIWKKFAFITAISGVGAVTRAPFGVMRSLEPVRRMYAGAVEEVVRLALAMEIELPPDYPAAMLDFLDGLPEDGTASMQRDILAGRPSELEAQTGAVVRLAREQGVSAPINDFLYAALLPQERSARHGD